MGVGQQCLILNQTPNTVFKQMDSDVSG